MRKFLVATLASLIFVNCGCDTNGPSGAQGELKVQENSLDFGSACPRPTSPDLKVEEQIRIVHVQNVGRGALTLNKFEVEEARRNVFQFDPAAIPGELGSGEAIEVPITFVPNGAGTVVADLTIQGDEEDKAPTVVKLVGEGKSAPPNPGVLVSCRGGKFDRPENPNDTCLEEDPTTKVKTLRDNANFFFRDVPLGEVGLIAFKVSNTGCPNLEISNITVTTDTSNGAQANTFRLDESQKTSLAVINGAEGEIKVAFNPLIADAIDGTLTFQTNDPAKKTVTIPIRGIGTEPVIAITPTTCDFKPETGFCTGMFSLSNSGDQALTINDVKLEKGSANFKLSGRPAAGTTIAPNGGSLPNTIKIDYTPDIAADITDYVVVNSTGGVARALLRGGSFPVLETVPDYEINFGENLDSTQTYYRRVVIKNTRRYNQQLPLTVKSIAITHSAPANAFKLEAKPGDPLCPAKPADGTRINAGQELAFCISFKPPLQGGEGTATVRILTDDPSWPDAQPYEVVANGATTCNPKPVAELTVPTTTACGVGNPCAGQTKCIDGVCHATGSFSWKLGDGTDVILSCAGSHDFVPNQAGQCTVEDRSKIKFCKWTLATRPSGSVAALTPSGQTAQKTTALTVDKQGQYNVRLTAIDDTGQESPITTFTVTVVP